MCIILDTNAFSNYVNGESDTEPVRQWLEGRGHVRPKGKIVYSPTTAIKKEIARHEGFRLKILELQRANRVRIISPMKVKKREGDLGEIKSDDPHILALALEGQVGVLVSQDKKLGEDFKRLTGGRGRIYKKASHKHLLTKDLCA